MSARTTGALGPAVVSAPPTATEPTLVWNGDTGAVTGTVFTVNIPAGTVVNGDILVMVYADINAAGVTPSDSAGGSWSTADQGSGASYQTRTAYRTVNGDVPTSVTMTVASSQTSQMAVLVIRGAASVDSAPGGAGSNSSVTNVQFTGTTSSRDFLNKDLGLYCVGSSVAATAASVPTSTMWGGLILSLSYLQVVICRAVGTRTGITTSSGMGISVSRSGSGTRYTYARELIMRA